MWPDICTIRLIVRRKTSVLSFFSWCAKDPEQTQQSRDHGGQTETYYFFSALTHHLYSGIWEWWAEYEEPAPRHEQLSAKLQGNYRSTEERTAELVCVTFGGGSRYPKKSWQRFLKGCYIFNFLNGVYLLPFLTISDLGVEPGTVPPEGQTKEFMIGP